MKTNKLIQTIAVVLTTAQLFGGAATAADASANNPKEKKPMPTTTTTTTTAVNEGDGPFATGDWFADHIKLPPVIKTVRKEPLCKWRFLWGSSYGQDGGWHAMGNRYDMESYRKLYSDYMKRYKLNAVFHYYYGAAFAENGQPDFPTIALFYPKYPKINEERLQRKGLKEASANLKLLSKMAAENDISFFTLYFPFNFLSLEKAGLNKKELTANQVVELTNNVIDEYFQTYPDLAGLMGHTAEVSRGDSLLGIKGMTETEAAHLIMQTAYDRCRKHGKLMAWDFHAHAGNHYRPQMIIDGLTKGTMPDALAISESNFPEQFHAMKQPTTWVMKALFDRNFQNYIPLNDVYGIERTGVTAFLPCIVDKYIVHHFTNSQKAGATNGGVFQATYSGPFSEYNTLANLNLELQARLMWDGIENVNPDEVMKEWLERNFGKEATPHLFKAFSKVCQINNDARYVGSVGANWAWQPQVFPQNPYRGAYQLQLLDKPGTNLYPPDPFKMTREEWNKHIRERHWSLREAPDFRIMPIAEMRAEKDRAVAGAEECLKDIEAAKAFLPKGAYDSLESRFLALWHLAKSCRVSLDALYYYKNGYLDHYDPDARDCVSNMKKAVEELKTLYEGRNDPRFDALTRSSRGGMDIDLFATHRNIIDHLEKELKEHKPLNDDNAPKPNQ